MADRDNLSIAEILAAARKSDGEEGGDSSSSAPSEPEASAPAPVKKAPAEKTPAKSASAAGAGSSVADILAAARASASDDAGGSGEADSAEESEPAAAAPAKPSKPAGQMSVAEMLAAARGEKSGGVKEAKKPAAKKSPKPKAAAASEAAAPAKPSGPKDTASILAAARKSAKSGPISKAEAADRAKPEAPAKAAKKAPPMPEKPAYARAEPARASADAEDRRGFFGLFLGSYLAFGFTALGLTHLLWTLGFARFMFPNILTEPPTSFKVGPPGNFAPGSVETKFKAQFGVWVVNAMYNGAQIIFALKSVCTHLGCTPNWLEAEQKFKCPCHGSGFYKDGINFEGPAPRPLERYAVSVAADGQLEVDKSTTFQEEKGQWTDPASFVNV